MSAADDLAYLQAQRAVVQAQLERLRPEQGLMRIHLESRLHLLNEEMAALETEQMLDRRARAVLTFDGKPVVEARAIEATFGAKALQAFQRLVSTTAATRGGRKLGARGTIPDEERHRLFITGTLPGSFGFELEEVAEASEQEPGALRDAVDEASRLLQATQMDEESFADAVSQSNDRVVKALADFLELMESKEATLRLTAGTRECVFETPEMVAMAAERARKTHITEVEEPVRGVLSGVFFKSRRFEYQTEQSGEVISGRIAEDIADPTSLKAYLGTTCIAHLWVVTVERAGKERRTYYLTNIEPLPGEESAERR